MNLLANENLPLDAIQALRNAGHDVFWVRTECPGLEDEKIFKRAVEEKRQALESRNDWEGHFAVVTDNQIRMKVLR